MGQRVEYEALIGSRYEQYLIKLRLVSVSHRSVDPVSRLSEIFSERTAFGTKKNRASLSLVDIVWDRKQVKMGPIARKLDAEGSDDAAQDLLYEHMKAQNILLVKYVSRPWM